MKPLLQLTLAGAGLLLTFTTPAQDDRSVLNPDSLGWFDGANALLPVPVHQRRNPWFIAGGQAVSRQQAAVGIPVRRAKNVILFVGDGMGVSTVTAARILDGQAKGMLGEENNLAMDTMPFTALIKTYNVDAQTPDSAGTMSAIMTGVKTNVGTIGIDEDVVRRDCSTMENNRLTSMLDLAELAGKSTGIVTTARVTHATPAATYARSPDRNWEDDAQLASATAGGNDTNGCKDIARQLIDYRSDARKRFPGALGINGLEVVMGGGRRHFLPADLAYNTIDYSGSIGDTEGKRTDGRDLISEWKAKYPNGTYVFDKAGFEAIDVASTSHLFGLFQESHMRYETDKGKDRAGEPTLTEMVKTALSMLKKNRNGFFLVVESGRIDHAHHAGSAHVALKEAVELSKAIKAARASVNMAETLMLVTADHSHVFTIAGYPRRGNPILGKVIGVGNTVPVLASDGMPYTTVSYANGRGFRDLGPDVTSADLVWGTPPFAGRVDLTGVDTTTIGFHQEVTVPLNSETHAGEDVALYGQGPSAWLVGGTQEQSVIYHIMDRATSMFKAARARQRKLIRARQ